MFIYLLGTEVTATITLVYNIMISVVYIKKEFPYIFIIMLFSHREVYFVYKRYVQGVVIVPHRAD